MARSSMLKEFWLFLKDNKKWWLLPVILMVVLIGGLAILAQALPAIAPFIYTLH